MRDYHRATGSAVHRAESEPADLQFRVCSILRLLRTHLPAGDWSFATEHSSTVSGTSQDEQSREEWLMGLDLMWLGLW